MSSLRLACTACSAPWDGQTVEKPFAVVCEACHAVEELQLDITGKLTGRRTLTPGTGAAWSPAEDVHRMVEAMDPSSELVPIAKCNCGAPLLLDDGVKVEVTCGYCGELDVVLAAHVPAKGDLGHIDVALPNGGLLRYRFVVRRATFEQVRCPWCDAEMDWEPGERACTSCGGAVGVGDDPHGLRSSAGVSIEGFDGRRNVRLAMTPAAADKDVHVRLAAALEPAAEGKAVPAARPIAAPRPTVPVHVPLAMGMAAPRPNAPPSPATVAAAAAPRPTTPPIPAAPPRALPVALAAPPPMKFERIPPPPAKSGGAGVAVALSVVVLLGAVGAGVAAFALGHGDARPAASRPGGVPTFVVPPSRPSTPSGPRPGPSPRPGSGPLKRPGSK